MKTTQRLITMILGLALLLAGLAPGAIQAQDESEWFVYVMNMETRELLRINTDGVEATYQLEVPDSVFLSGFDMSFSRDGRITGFCAVDYSTETESTPPATLYVRDIPAENDLLVKDMGQAIGCTTRGGFDQDAARIAVSRVNYFPGDPNVDPEGPVWQLQVVDVASGEIVDEISSSSEAVVAAGLLTDLPVLPEVLSFDGDALVFAEVPYGIGGIPEIPAYRWDLASGSIELVDESTSGYFGTDRLPGTGETAEVAFDETLPAGDPGGPMPAFNVVRLTAADGTAQTVYHSPEWLIGQVEFIEGGRRLAINIFPSFDPEAEMQADTARWIALDRQGNVSDLRANLEYGEIAAAPGGFVLFEINFEGAAGNRFTLTLTQGDQQTVLWEATGQNWEMVYVRHVPTAEGLAPFTAVNP